MAIFGSLGKSGRRRQKAAAVARAQVATDIIVHNHIGQRSQHLKSQQTRKRHHHNHRKDNNNTMRPRSQFYVNIDSNDPASTSLPELEPQRGCEDSSDGSTITYGVDDIRLADEVLQVSAALASQCNVTGMSGGHGLGSHDGDVTIAAAAAAGTTAAHASLAKILCESLGHSRRDRMGHQNSKPCELIQPKSQSYAPSNAGFTSVLQELKRVHNINDEERYTPFESDKDKKSQNRSVQDTVQRTKHSKFARRDTLDCLNTHLLNSNTTSQNDNSKVKSNNKYSCDTILKSKTVSQSVNKTASSNSININNNDTSLSQTINPNNEVQEEITVCKKVPKLENSSVTRNLPIPSIVLGDKNTLVGEHRDRCGIGDVSVNKRYSHTSEGSSENDSVEDRVTLTIEDVERSRQYSSSNTSGSAGEDGDLLLHGEIVSSKTNGAANDRLHLDTVSDYSRTDGTKESTLGIPDDATSEEKQARKAFQIAQEIMTSERVFVDVLQLLNVDFRNFIHNYSSASGTPPTGSKTNSKPCLPVQELNKILNYLPQLQNLNSELLNDLERRIADWDGHGRKVADIIVRMGPFLKLYSTYIKEFQAQCDLLDDCTAKYNKFERALREFENSDRCVNLTIKHYMLKPVQRLPQYRLLLEQYLSRLGPHDNDYLDASTALTIVAQVANHANDTMKHASNFVKLLSLQERLLGFASGTNHRYELVKPGRYLLREGELLKLCRRGMQPRYFILLSDVLLYTHYNAGGTAAGLLRLNCELPLEGMRVDIPHAQDFDNEFSIITEKRSFTLQASSPSEREGWLTALKDAIAENASRRSSFLTATTSTFQQPQSNTLGKQAPVWIPDYRVTMCQQCTAEFTLTFRRHHCRACGKVVCDHCSANRAPLQYKRNQSARVCDNCFESLLKDFDNKTSDNPERTSEKTLRRVSSMKSQFKRGIRDNRSGRQKIKKRVPDRLMEVCASDTGSQMSGYLKCTIRKSWHRGWFVLKDRVLYEYRAPQDIRALQSLPILGYNVESVSKMNEVPDGVDVSQAFQLTHSNQLPFVFYADSPHLADKWINAMKEAVVLT